MTLRVPVIHRWLVGVDVEMADMCLSLDFGSGKIVDRTKGVEVRVGAIRTEKREVMYGIDVRVGDICVVYELGLCTNALQNSLSSTPAGWCDNQ